jgi:hypothetical protein
MVITQIIFSQEYESKNYLSSSQIKDRIYQNLERLQSVYLKKLKSNDYQQSRELLFDTYLLLFSIPDFDFDDVYYVMTDNDFKMLLSDLKEQSFTEEKLSIIGLASSSNNFTVAQVYQIVETIDFTEDRIEAIELLYPSIVDKYNSYRLLSLFSNSIDKQTVRNIITNYNLRRK